MANTPKLGMPEIAESQGGKYVTHNESLAILDAIVGGGIEDKDLTTPPSHVHGNVWIVGASATGAWSGKDGQLAQSYNSAWTFIVPKEGWRVWLKDEDIWARYTGSAWVSDLNLPLDTIASGQTILVPTSRQLIVSGVLDVNGILDIDGTVEVL